MCYILLVFSFAFRMMLFSLNIERKLFRGSFACLARILDLDKSFKRLMNRAVIQYLLDIIMNNENISNVR